VTRRFLIPLSSVLIVAAVVLAVLGTRAPANCRRLSCLQTTPSRSAVPLASINLEKEKITPSGPNAKISKIDFGSEIAFTVPDDSAPLAYRLSIPLSSGQRLGVLTKGGAAITDTLPLPMGCTSEYQCQAQDGFLDPDYLRGEGMSDQEIADYVKYLKGLSSGPAKFRDIQDPSWYPRGNKAESDDRDGADIASHAFELVQNQIPDGNWVMVSAFDPPRATDANGLEIPIFLTKEKQRKGEEQRAGLIVTVAPPSSATFPLKVRLRYGYDPDSFGP
jgi:hypothetical protein